MMPPLTATGLGAALGPLGILAARATIVLAAAALATLAMKRASAAIRHLVWSGAFAGVLLLPFLDALLPAWRLLPAAAVAVAPVRARAVPDERPALTVRASASPASALARSIDESRGADRSSVAPSAASPHGVRLFTEPQRSADGARASAQTTLDSARTHGSLSRPAIVVLAWLAGVALLLARLVTGTLVIGRLVRRTVPVDDPRTLVLAERVRAQLGIRRRVRVLGDPLGTVPMTWGIAAPVVVLPAESSAWSDERRRLVLSHELAHVARLDGATQLVAQLAAAIFWFHPLVWLALRALRHERERACDDLVLATGARASDYARDLVELATRLAPSPASAAAFGMARRSELEGRVLAILDPNAPRARAGWRATSVAVTGAAALTLIAATVAQREAMAATAPPARHATRVAPTVALRADASAAGTNVELSLSQPVASTEPAPDAGVRPEPAADAAVPAPSAIGGSTLSLSAELVAPAARDTVPAAAAPTADRATLLMVADAAKRISSDAEKSTLLQAVYPRYRTDDELRAAYLDVVATLSSDNARAEALVRVARGDALSAAVLVQAIAIAAATSADYEQGRALQALAGQPALSDPRAHRAFFDATMRISSSTAEGAVLASLLRRPAVTDAELVSAMQAAAMMSSAADAANVLVAVARRHALDSDALRTAFVAAAGKLSSDAEYRRVMTAAGISH